MSDTEALITSCNSPTEIRKAAEKNPQLRSAVLASMEPVKIIFQRLELQGQKFSMFSSASEEDLVEMWSQLNPVDAAMQYGGVYRLQDLTELNTFLGHCCQPFQSRSVEKTRVLFANQFVCLWKSFVISTTCLTQYLVKGNTMLLLMKSTVQTPLDSIGLWPTSQERKAEDTPIFRQCSTRKER